MGRRPLQASQRRRGVSASCPAFAFAACSGVYGGMTVLVPSARWTVTALQPLMRHRPAGTRLAGPGSAPDPAAARRAEETKRARELWSLNTPSPCVAFQASQRRAGVVVRHVEDVDKRPNFAQRGVGVAVRAAVTRGDSGCQVSRLTRHHDPPSMSLSPMSLVSLW